MTQTEVYEPCFEINIENPKPNSQDPGFNQVFLKAIDSTLSLLGGSSKRSFYLYLENNFGIAESQIPDAIEEFAEALEKVFGHAAQLIEIRIIRELHEAIPNFKFPGREGFAFADYVESLRLFVQF